jgi:hypothetical protein
MLLQILQGYGVVAGYGSKLHEKLRSHLKKKFIAPDRQVFGVESRGTGVIPQRLTVKTDPTKLSVYLK